MMAVINAEEFYDLVNKALRNPSLEDVGVDWDYYSFSVETRYCCYTLFRLLEDSALYLQGYRYVIEVEDEIPEPIKTLDELLDRGKK